MSLATLKRFLHVVFPGLFGPVKLIVDSKEVSRRFTEEKIKSLTPRGKLLYQELVQLSMNPTPGFFGFKNLEAEFVTRHFTLASKEGEQHLSDFLNNGGGYKSLDNALHEVLSCQDMWYALEAYYWKLTCSYRLSERELEWWRVFCYEKIKSWLDSNKSGVKSYGVSSLGYQLAIDNIISSSPTLKEVVC